MVKKALSAVLAMAMLASVLSACKEKEPEYPVEEVRTEFGEPLSLEEVAIAGKLSKEYNFSFEAEDGELFGNTAILNEMEGYTGTGFLYPIDSDNDGVTIASVPETGLYDLNFRSASMGGSEAERYILTM